MEQRKLKIKELIIEKLNLKLSPEEISDEASLFANTEDGGVGLDSVDALEIAVGIMNEFEVEISDEDMHIFQSVQAIDDFVANQLQEGN